MRCADLRGRVASNGRRHRPLRRADPAARARRIAICIAPSIGRACVLLGPLCAGVIVVHHARELGRRAGAGPRAEGGVEARPVAIDPGSPVKGHPPSSPERLLRRGAHCVEHARRAVARTVRQPAVDRDMRCCGRSSPSGCCCSRAVADAGRLRDRHPIDRQRDHVAARGASRARIGKLVHRLAPTAAVQLAGGLALSGIAGSIAFGPWPGRTGRAVRPARRPPRCPGRHRCTSCTARSGRRCGGDGSPPSSPDARRWRPAGGRARSHRRWG